MVVSESTFPLSSALCTPRAPLGLSIQTVSRREGKKVQEPFLKALRGGSAESLFQQSLREHGTGRFTAAIGADSS